MRNRTILIVEKESELRTLLVGLCQAVFITPVTADSVACARYVLPRNQIDEIITGSLHGNWKQVVKVARQHDSKIPITLWTADLHYRHPAERLGVRFMNQDNFELLDLLKAQNNSA